MVSSCENNESLSLWDCEPKVCCRTVAYVRYSNWKSDVWLSGSRKEARNSGSRARQAARARGYKFTLQWGCNARRWLNIFCSSCDGSRYPICPSSSRRRGGWKCGHKHTSWHILLRIAATLLGRGWGGSSLHKVERRWSSFWSGQNYVGCVHKN